MKYVDASAVLRLLFSEEGPIVPIEGGEPLVSSSLVEVETFRAVDRARLLGHLGDVETAVKRQELGEILARMDILAIDAAVIRRASDPFAVNVRALDAIHVATAEMLRADSGETLEFYTRRPPGDRRALARHCGAGNLSRNARAARHARAREVRNTLANRSANAIAWEMRGSSRPAAMCTTRQARAAFARRGPDSVAQRLDRIHPAGAPRR